MPCWTGCSSIYICGTVKGSCCSLPAERDLSWCLQHYFIQGQNTKNSYCIIILNQKYTTDVLMCTCLLRHISERTRTCPGRMREINLRDQSHTSRSWGPEISRFGVDYVRLSIWIQNLWDDEEKLIMCINCTKIFKSDRFKANIKWPILCTKQFSMKNY